MTTQPASQPATPLRDAVRPSPDRIVDPAALGCYGGVTAEAPVLVLLAAGKGTRFGQDPKCIQPVHGIPLARHSINAFRRFTPSPVVCLVGYRSADVASALGADNIYVLSTNPAGGTALAAFEAFSVSALLEQNPLLFIGMGDRIVPSRVFRMLYEIHTAGPREAALTFLAARYEPPRNSGKGRVVRGEDGRVLSIIEERDIRARFEGAARDALLDITEANCPLYLIRAATLYRHLLPLTNDNAQGQFYITDIVEAISRENGEIRTLTTNVTDPEYDLLCADVTRPMDLALLEGILASNRALLFPEELEVENAARAIAAGRPPAQTASIARQLSEVALAVAREKLPFDPARPVSIGISGGRLRLAFMHPDMVRFYGPAWQTPIGAGSRSGTEQIVILAQEAADGRIALFPLEARYRESVDFVPSDTEAMYPGDDVSDLHSYEAFGTRMSESLLLSLGYFSDEELERRRAAGLPLPPPSLWIGGSMRRPFALIGNTIASLRTLRTGTIGARVQKHLGKGNFKGLHLVSTGSIPQGGFSSSSAVTVAAKNAINALYELGIPPDLLVHLACQAEYGTGVRAGSLDQATEQKGIAGQGALISSNPRDNYRILATHPLPDGRFQIVFPYSVDRDRAAWRWSWGAYAERPVSTAGPLTTGETRKMTGKAAEIAAILTDLSPDTDFFKHIEQDLLDDGLLTRESRAWICSVLRRLPLCASVEDLRCRTGQPALFAGWRDPVIFGAPGVPLRAMVAYLFAEVAKNFYLVHHPAHWIEYVTRSQRGDRSVEIDPAALPSREEMESELPWESAATGPDRMNLWLERHGAVPFDFNRGLDDESLSLENPPEFHLLEGGNFFRGLALVDLAEAMLKRAFGDDAIAVRVNAAGQGDYFQVHIDTEKAAPAEVKRFIRLAFYRRFGLTPPTDFVEIHPGGGALGIRLNRYDLLTQLIPALERLAAP